MGHWAALIWANTSNIVFCTLFDPTENVLTFVCFLRNNMEQTQPDKDRCSLWSTGNHAVCHINNLFFIYEGTWSDGCITTQLQEALNQACGSIRQRTPCELNTHERGFFRPVHSGGQVYNIPQCGRNGFPLISLHQSRRQPLKKQLCGLPLFMPTKTLDILTYYRIRTVCTHNLDNS